MSARPHGVCTACGRNMTLKKDGTLRHHAGAPTTQWPYREYMCGGAGLLPVAPPGPDRNPRSLGVTCPVANSDLCVDCSACPPCPAPAVAETSTHCPWCGDTWQRHIDGNTCSTRPEETR